MLLSLCRCQLRHIHHESINITTSILGGRRWYGIWWIIWSHTRYWISLQVWSCVMWRSVWLLTNRGQLRRINNRIIKCRRHRYYRWWQLIALWVNAIEIKAPVIMVSVFCLPQLFPVPHLWRLPTLFGRGMMNEIWVYGGFLCLLFCLLIANRMWEPTFWRDNCSRVRVKVQGIKPKTIFLSQYNSK